MRVPLSFRTLSLALALGAVLIASPNPSNAQNATDVAWTTFKGDNTRSGSSPATVSLPLALQWRFSSTGPTRTYSTSPLVIGATGQQKIIFASGANVYALDLASGSQLWKSPDLSSDVVTPLTLLTTDEGDFVVGAQSRGKVFALETIKGALKWEADTKSSVTEAGPLVLNTPLGTQILTSLSNGTIIAFDKAGKLIPDWKVTLDKYGSSPLGNMTISPDKSRLYVQTSDQKIVCVDVPTGRQLWRANLSSRSSTAPVAGGDMVVTTTMEQIAAFRDENGTLAWRYKLPGVVQGSPALAQTPKGSTVYFGTRNGDVLALDALTGLPRWQKKYDFTFSGSPLALKNIVLIGTSNGLLIGIDPATGDVTWQYRMKTERTVTTRVRTQNNNGGEGGPMMGGGGAAAQEADTVRTFGISSAPAVINNRVFVLGDNAALYGFTGESFDSDPPRVAGPTLSVPDTAKNLASLEIKDTQKVIPGTGPIYFSAELDDIGTGINPSTVKVQFDDQDLDADRVDYDSQSGNLTLTLVGAAKGSLALEEGLKTIKIQAVDYAGNALDYTVSFMVDSLATPPQAPATNAPGEGGFPGGGGPFGGGGFPGGGGPFGGGGGFPGGGGGQPFGGGGQPFGGGGGQFGGDGGNPFGGGGQRPGAMD